MKKTIILSIAALTLLLSGCGSKKEAASTNSNVEKVRVQQISNQTVSRTVEYPSTLNAFEENHLAPAAPGRIEKIFVEVGSIVNKGDILVQMDRTNLHQAQVQLRNLETDYKRYQTLNNEGNIAKQQYDQIKAQLEIAKSNVEFLTENTQLRAPFSGVISGKYFENGEMYSGTPTAAGKAAIISLVQINQLKGFVSIPESYFPVVKTGMTAQLTCDIYKDKSFTGKVYRIHPTIDAQTRTFQVEVLIPNSSSLLRPGMFGRITLDMGKQTAALIPANAVLKLQGSNDRYLYVVRDGKAKRCGVTLGQRFDDMVEINSKELQEGDNIIVSGQSRLVDGVSVEVVK